MKNKLKGNISLMVLVGLLFAFIGLAFVFFTGETSKNNAKPSVAQAQKPEKTMENEFIEFGWGFKRQLQDFKNTITNLEKKEQKDFTKHTSKAFNQLSILIDKAAEKISEKQNEKNKLKEMIKTKTDKVRESAKKIKDSEDEKEIVTEIKRAFMNSKESLQKISREHKKEIKVKVGHGGRGYDILRKEIDEINTDNYQDKTQKIFRHFHSNLKCLAEPDCKMGRYSTLYPAEKSALAKQHVRCEECRMKHRQVEAYKHKLDKFKLNVEKIKTEDFEKFKKQTKSAFMNLAELIKYYPLYMSKEDKESLKNDAKTIREKANKISQLQTGEEVTNQIKDTFKTSHEALEEIAEMTEEALEEHNEHEAGEESSECAEERLEELEKKLKKFDIQQTKSSFMLIYRSLNCLIKPEIEK